MLPVLPTSEQELNNLLEVQLSSLVLDWSKRVDEKQTAIDELERKLQASNCQIEKLSEYISHWRRVKTELPRQKVDELTRHYNTTPTRSVRQKPQKRRRQQSPQPLQPQKSRRRSNFVTDLRNTLQYGA